MDTTIRTLMLDTSKRGRPKARYCPSLAGSRQKDLDTRIPKELGLPSLAGGMLGSQIRKKESRMVVAKDEDGKSPRKWNK